MTISSERLLLFLRRLSEEVADHRDDLTRLDASIGDADHGVNLNRGFTAVVDKLPDLADKDVGTILKTVGMTLISTVGGAAGPLYGTGFMRAGIVLGDRTELGSEDIVAALAAALEGIQSRGRAQRGEKTMVDAIAPAVDVLKTAQANGSDMRLAARSALRAAEEGMRATILMVATKGRASYLGERSAGHQDPGATSAYLMARVLFEVLEDEAELS